MDLNDHTGGRFAQTNFADNPQAAWISKSMLHPAY
jgi:hypothetical protein